MNSIGILRVYLASSKQGMGVGCNWWRLLLLLLTVDWLLSDSHGVSFESFELKADLSNLGNKWQMMASSYWRWRHLESNRTALEQPGRILLLFFRSRQTSTVRPQPKANNKPHRPRTLTDSFPFLFIFIQWPTKRASEHPLLMNPSNVLKCPHSWVSNEQLYNP